MVLEKPLLRETFPNHASFRLSTVVGQRYDGLSQTIVQGTLEGRRHAVVGGGNGVWTASKTSLPMTSITAYIGLPQKRLEEDLC